MLRDFAIQWHHILRHAYNDFTFGRLVSAIIRIATLDLQIKEVADRQHRQRGALVSNFEAPRWRFFESLLVPLETMQLILSQDLQRAIELGREDFAGLKHGLQDKTSAGKEQHQT